MATVCSALKQKYIDEIPNMNLWWEGETVSTEEIDEVLS